MPETARRPTLRAYTHGNAYFWTGITIGITVLIVSAIFGGYAANLKDSVAALDGKLDASEKARNRDQEQKLAAASKQSKVLRQLFANKSYWSQALASMERMTQSSVAFTQLSASLTKGVITFSGTADSYATVARQLAAFVDGTGIKDATLKSVRARTAGGVEFDGELQIDNKQLVLHTPTPTPSK